MKNIETLKVLEMNNRALNINLDGLSHEDCLVTPPGGGNNINWILGHMIISRDDMHEILGMKKKCNESFAEIYARGTSTISADKAIETDELLKTFNDIQKDLVDAVGNTDFSDREKELMSLTFLAFHEAYHTGQTGLLRRIAGKSGAIK
jgi:uncharacterized damage-inducible protein DinB